MTELEPALDELAGAGLNWVAFVPQEAAPAPAGCRPGAGRGLMLLLSLGSSFWERTPLQGRDPLDARARALTLAFMEAHLRPVDPDCELVYPSDHSLDLRAWLEQGHVQHRSRLGTGIRPDCGPWFAVRSAIWTAVTPSQREVLSQRFPTLAGASPCDTCTAAPCVAACPSAALRGGSPVGAVDLDRCVDHRLRPASSCAERCLARRACPVGEAYRYCDAQQRYHYGRSLVAIRRWKGYDVA